MPDKPRKVLGVPTPSPPSIRVSQTPARLFHQSPLHAKATAGAPSCQAHMDRTTCWVRKPHASRIGWLQGSTVCRIPKPGRLPDHPPCTTTWIIQGGQREQGTTPRQKTEGRERPHPSVLHTDRMGARRLPRDTGPPTSCRASEIPAEAGPLVICKPPGIKGCITQHSPTRGEWRRKASAYKLGAANGICPRGCRRRWRKCPSRPGSCCPCAPAPTQNRCFCL